MPLVKSLVRNKDQYLTPLNIPEGKEGEWSIEKEIIPPRCELSLANPRCMILGGQRGSKVSWPYPTTRHYLKQNGGTWMSDIPCEIAQMRKAIMGIRGRVLVGGLGLGLVATLLAQKKSVKEIVVVELELDVIKLVKDHLPKVVRDKSLIIQTDLMNYLKETPKTFDHAFYDIWCSDREGTFFFTVCPLYDLSKGKIKHPPKNWNEDVMRGQLSMSLYQRVNFLDPKVIGHLDPNGVMKNHPPPHQEIEGKPTQTIWHNWCVPFFKWIKEHNPSPEKIEQARYHYSQLYGKWDWQRAWEAAVKYGYV